MKIPEFQNFLKNPPHTQLNLVPNAEGEVNFTANLAPFTQLFVIAIDLTSVAQTQVDVTPVQPTQKRDLSLLQSLDLSKGYTESRTTIELLKHDTSLIEDITSTEIQLIDDLKKVKGVLEELMRTKYTSDATFKEFGGIFMKWPKMSFEEKNKEYYKSMCHELHIFLYFKDQEFF